MDYNIFEEDFFKSNVLGENGLLLKSENNYSKLDQIKKFLISILNDKLKKSFENLFFDMNEELLIKGKSYPVGTIREWQGKRFKKVSKGKWMRSYSEGEKSTGENIAIAKTIKKIQNAKSISELAQIVGDNKSRFEGKDGKIHPTVKQILGIAKEKKSVKQGETKENIEKEAVENTLNSLKKKGYTKAIINDKNEIFLINKNKNDSMLMPDVYETKHRDLVEKIFGKIEKTEIKEDISKKGQQKIKNNEEINKYNKKIIEDLKKQDLETLKRSIDGIEWNFKKGQEKLKELIEKKKNLEKEKLGEFQKQHYEKIKNDIEKYQKGLRDREPALKEFRKILEEKQKIKLQTPTKKEESLNSFEKRWKELTKNNLPMELNPFVRAIKESKSKEEALYKIKNMKNVPFHTSKMFREKYGIKNGKKVKTVEEAFDGLYKDVKNREKN